MTGLPQGPRNRHRLGRFSARFAGAPTGGSQLVLDLARPEALIEAGPTSASLVAYPSGRPLDGGFQPAIQPVEAWTMVDGLTLAQSDVFLEAQARLIRRALWRDPPVAQVSVPAVLLPHYSSQFGHFVAENLGQLLYHAGETLSIGAYSGYRVAALFPSPLWRDFVAGLVPEGSLLELSATDLLTARHEFPTCVRTVQIGCWQNLALARNHVMAWLQQKGGDSPAPVFLVDPKRTRIANLDATLDLLARLGFTVLDPTGAPVEGLLLRLRDARVVVCEASSILMNVVLSRSAPTLVLTPAGRADEPDLAEFAGGAIYVEFLRGLLRHVPCPIAEDEAGNGHVFSRRIRVDLRALEEESQGASR